MCGIVGYVGKKQVVPVIIEGLRKLEYRGYDSAGIAVGGNGEGLQIRRAEGKLRNLEEVIRLKPLDGTYGIGHTRPPHRRKRPSASRLHRQNRGGAQRHCRELSLAQEEVNLRRTQVHHRNGYGNHRAPGREVLSANRKWPPAFARRSSAQGGQGTYRCVCVGGDRD